MWNWHCADREDYDRGRKCRERGGGSRPGRGTGELQTNTEERIQAAAINTVSVANWTLDTFFHHHHQTFSISDVLMTPHLFRIETNYIEIFDSLFINSFPYSTLFENYSKCRISILAFSTSFCPIKTDLSGNTVWPQDSGFQKLPKLDHFWHF